MMGLEDSKMIQHVPIRLERKAAQEADQSKDFLSWKFPTDRKKIARLTAEQKLEWYQKQMEEAAKAGHIAYELLTDEFARFWKWHILWPMKMKRFYYRVKNLEIFKRYPHITEIKKVRDKK